MVSFTGLNPEDLASSQKKKMVNGKLKFKFGFDSENQYFAFKIICGRISAIWDKSAPINSIKIMNFPPLSTIGKKFLAKKKSSSEIE